MIKNILKIFGGKAEENKAAERPDFKSAKTEYDVLKLVDSLIDYARLKDPDKNEPFWTLYQNDGILTVSLWKMCLRHYLTAVVGYIVCFLPEDEKNFSIFNTLINKMHIKGNIIHTYTLNDIFKEVKLGTEEFLKGCDNEESYNYDKIPPCPNHFCVAYYEKFLFGLETACDRNEYACLFSLCLEKLSKISDE